MSKPQQRSCNTRMTSRSSLQNTGKAKEVSGVSTGGLTDTPACCPRWGATTAGAARHPEQTVVRLLLLARLYVALQHCPRADFHPCGRALPRGNSWRIACFMYVGLAACRGDKRQRSDATR